MKNKYFIFIIIHLSVGCGSGNNKSGDFSSAIVAVDTSADSYIEDSEQNDNLTIVETSCDLQGEGAKVEQYYSSEALGEGFFVSSEYTLPLYRSWSNDTYVVEDGSDECNSPGYRALSGSTVAEASTNTANFLYGCGGKCTYAITEKSIDENGKFNNLTVTWVCSDVGVNNLLGPGNFGNSVDKHVGKVECK